MLLFRDGYNTEGASYTQTDLIMFVLHNRNYPVFKLIGLTEH